MHFERVKIDVRRQCLSKLYVFFPHVLISWCFIGCHIPYRRRALLIVHHEVDPYHLYHVGFNLAPALVGIDT